MEIVPTLDLMRYFARHTARLLKAERIDIGLYGLMGRSSRVTYRPVGVIGVISPWNFPWAIPLGEVVMALMAGNAVALKPSELTPFVGLRIGDVFRRAGLPDGLLRSSPATARPCGRSSRRAPIRSCSREASRPDGASRRRRRGG